MDKLEDLKFPAVKATVCPICERVSKSGIHAPGDICKNPVDDAGDGAFGPCPGVMETLREDGKPYQPSNGSEGQDFTESWCNQCEREREYRESEGEDWEKCCPILGASMANSVGDDDYPKEWIYKDGKPVCTAFVTEGRETHPIDDKTLPMFPEKEADVE